MEVIDNLKQRLASFVDLRNGMRYLNTDYNKLSTSYTKHAERLTSLRNLKENALTVNFASCSWFCCRVF
jgi:DNA repair ATPase RecN